MKINIKKLETLVGDLGYFPFECRPLHLHSDCSFLIKEIRSYGDLGKALTPPRNQLYSTFLNHNKRFT